MAQLDVRRDTKNYSHFFLAVNSFTMNIYNNHRFTIDILWRFILLILFERRPSLSINFLLLLQLLSILTSNQSGEQRENKNLCPYRGLLSGEINMNIQDVDIYQPHTLCCWTF